MKMDITSKGQLNTEKHIASIDIIRNNLMMAIFGSTHLSEIIMRVTCSHQKSFYNVCQQNWFPLQLHIAWWENTAIDNKKVFERNGRILRNSVGDRAQDVKNHASVFIVASVCLSFLQSQFGSHHGEVWPSFCFCVSEAVLVCSFVQ